MLQEIYFWMTFYVKKIKTNDTPEFNSYLLMCVLVNANIWTIVIIVSSLLDFNPKSLGENGKTIGLICGLFIMVVNYFLLFSKRKQIYAKYEQLPSHRKARGMIFFWIYAILSLPLLFIAGVNLVG